MDYTEDLENKLFEFWTDDEDTDIEKMIYDFRDQQNKFRSFSEALTFFIKKKMPEGYQKSEKEYLKECSEKRGIKFNRNTINNWFDGKRPKKGIKSREHMYMIAFSLELDVEETKELFEKVYYDKAFNYRQVEEFIYFYCLKREKTYDYAKQLISHVTFDDIEEGTIFTESIRGISEGLEEDKELLEWISVHPHNFHMNNISAKRILDKLLYDIKGRDGEKKKIEEGTVDQGCSYIARECSLRSEALNLISNKTFTSISTMLDIIMDVNFVKERECYNKGFFKNIEMPKEILSRFPTKEVFSKENPTYEELRKMIILLFSYKFWFEVQYQNSNIGLDDYIAQIDDILYESSLQELYFGNPYDWMFAFCTMSERPLDRFRNLMVEVFAGI